MKSSSPESATIEFVGELTIRTIADTHARLVETLGASRTVRAAIDADAACDLTFVQLICSARRTARDEGCSFGLASPAAGQLRETLERGGFLAAAEDREFWLLQNEGV